MTLQLALAFVKGQCRYKSVCATWRSCGTFRIKRVSQAETWPSSLFALTFWVASSGQPRWLRRRCCVVVVVVVVVEPA